MSDQPASGERRAKPKKKTPSAFQAARRPKAADPNLISSIIAGADDVAGRSFLGANELRPSSLDQATISTEADDSPQDPSPTDVTSADAEADAAISSQSSGLQQVSSPPVKRPPAQPSSSRKATGQAQPAPSAAEFVADSAEPQEAAPNRGVPHPTKAETDFPVVASDRETPPSTTAGRQPQKAWAHAAVHESYAQAKIRSEEWQQHGFRIEPEILGQLKERIKVDRRTSGNSTLAVGHYLDAALRHAPTEVGEQIAWAQKFLDDRMAYVGKGRQSTYRIGPQAHDLMSSLHQALQEADYGRRGLYVISAAIERFIAALAAEGELQRPERRAL
jgi:hypothetical protein